MDAFGSVVGWIYRAIATWYAAAIVGGVLILIADRRSRAREPTDDEVRIAADRYRQYYGGDAFRVVGDHMLGASFAPDGRHRAFLRRVSSELVAGVVTDDDRAIEHRGPGPALSPRSPPPR